jgi:succinyl-CoA synthetase beta subunit
MLFLEHDAKELLAIQGIPVPGSIRLAQVPTGANIDDSGVSGPWLVKPQILTTSPGQSPDAIAAHTNAEIAAAASALLGKTIGGQIVRSVLVERRMTAQSMAHLSFRCDPASAGLRIEVGDGAHRDASPSEVVAPDPNAVIACVNRLSTSLPGDARSCVAAAGRMLAPLYFGYEAILLDIDPLMILADGSWTVGDVRLAIDESALFRHPELIALLERRVYAYGDIRQHRASGIDYRVLDPDGSVATIASGAGHCAYLLDELVRRGVQPYNFMDAGPTALNGPAEGMHGALQWLQAAKALRCILVAISDGTIDLTACAAHLASALEQTADFKTPVVVRMAGTGAGAAGAILQQASDRVILEPNIDAALDLVAAHVAGAPG